MHTKKLGECSTTSRFLQPKNWQGSSLPSRSEHYIYSAITEVICRVDNYRVHMMAADICVWFCAHRLMYRPFCVQDNSATATICSYISLASIPLQSISGAQQKWPKRVGQGRGVCRPFAKNSQQPPYPCSCLISLASTTDKLIFESYVIVIYLTWAVALWFFCTYYSQRVILVLAAAHSIFSA